MLVLSRKTQESVVVGGCDGFERLLKIIVVEIDGGHLIGVRSDDPPDEEPDIVLVRRKILRQPIEQIGIGGR